MYMKRFFTRFVLSCGDMLICSMFNEKELQTQKYLICDYSMKISKLVFVPIEEAGYIQKSDNVDSTLANFHFSQPGIITGLYEIHSINVMTVVGLFKLYFCRF